MQKRGFGWHLVPLCSLNAAFSDIVVRLPPSAARLSGGAPAALPQHNLSCGSRLSSSARCLPSGQDRRVQNPDDILNSLAVLVLAACLSPPRVRGSQLDGEVSGSEGLQPGVRQLHNWDSNMKKGKISRAAPKKNRQLLMNLHCWVHTCARKHTHFE